VTRDWVTIGAIALAGLPGLAALLALFFTYQQVHATSVQLQIAEQGQITDSYNAAITNLGSSSIEVRLGGIYGLQSLMQDSPGNQPTVIAVLCAFVRDQTSSAVRASQPTSQLRTDIQAALTVVGTRNTADDGRTTVIDFDHAQLANAQLGSLHLSGADFSFAYLIDADLSGADLSGADLDDTIVSSANLTGANLTSAYLIYADLSDADLSGADLAGADIRNTGLESADLSSADLHSAYVADANLSGAFLTGANLTGVNLTGANLTGANLTGANLTGANLTGANLTGANLTGANLTSANLTGATWSRNVPPPEGWVRHPVSGRLARADARA
jgi:uncharacterized protein YjbI with pentapeptide repeats